MKALTQAALIAFSLITAAHAGDLTEAQKKSALSEIDSVCGDTWCEGDYQFKFNRINCDFKAKTCTLDFRMSLEDGRTKSDAEFKYSIQSKSNFVQCTVPGVTKFSDLVEKTGNYQRLNQDFYTKLTSCINALEKDL